MLFKRKRTELNLERYDGFHIQKTFDCDKRLKTVFFQLEKVIDEQFIEYLKPFGYAVQLPGGIVEIQRDEYFKLMIPLGKNSFHAEIEPGAGPDVMTQLLNQVYRGIHNIIRENILEKCGEDAIDISNDVFRVDKKKCTYCLDCVI